MFFPSFPRRVYSSVEDMCSGKLTWQRKGPITQQATRLSCYKCAGRSFPLRWLLSFDLINIRNNHLKPRRNFKVKANCVLFVFVFFKLKNLQTESFANCFVVCFDIRGLAKNKEGKDLESILITCTAEVRKMRVTMKMRSYEYKKLHQDKGETFS